MRHGVTSGVSHERCTTKRHRRWGATWCYLGCFVRDIFKQLCNTSPPQGVCVVCLVWPALFDRCLACLYQICSSVPRHGWASPVWASKVNPPLPAANMIDRGHAERPHAQTSELINLNCSEQVQLCTYCVSRYMRYIQINCCTSIYIYIMKRERERDHV